MKKVLVTGATGFLGGYLVKELVGEYTVYALGRNERRGAELEKLGAVFVKGDFTDLEHCEECFIGMDYLIHAGALSTAWGRWEDFYKTNVEGSENVARMCQKHGIKRMVYVSSPSIYTAKRDRISIREDDVDSFNRLNHYIQSKILSENILKEYQQQGLYTVILRPRGLFGIGDTSLVPRLLRANEKIGIPLVNRGSNLVDITCVENAAYACKLAISASDISGQVFNITNGEPIVFRSVLEKLLEHIGNKPKYLRLPLWLIYMTAALMEKFYTIFSIKGEPVLTRYMVCTLGYSQTLDISRAQERLEYKPIKTLNEGIAEYGRWWKENH